MAEAVWRKRGKPDQTGVYEYYRPGGFFWVRLNSKDPVTGLRRVFQVYDHDVSFNGYTLEPPHAD